MPLSRTFAHYFINIIYRTQGFLFSCNTVTVDFMFPAPGETRWSLLGIGEMFELALERGLSVSRLSDRSSSQSVSVLVSLLCVGEFKLYPSTSLTWEVDVACHIQRLYLDYHQDSLQHWNHSNHYCTVHHCLLEASEMRCLFDRIQI